MNSFQRISVSCTKMFLTPFLLFAAAMPPLYAHPGTLPTPP